MRNLMRFDQRLAARQAALVILFTVATATSGTSSMFGETVAAELPELKRLSAFLPASAADLDHERLAGVTAAAATIESWAADTAWKSAGGPPTKVLSDVQQLVDAKQQIDAALDSTLALRFELADLADTDRRRAQIPLFLKTASTLIDLSGRLRYLLRDAIDQAAVRLAEDRAGFDALFALLIEKRVGIGAAAMSFVLFDPPPGSPVQPFPAEVKINALKLMAAARKSDSIPQLAEFVRVEQNPQLLVIACDVIRYIGLPQSPRPGRDPALPPPAITAEELKSILTEVAVSQLNTKFQRRHADLLSWLDVRIERGVIGDSYRVGDFMVQAGDWFLMRNPSPYNLFTDLSPGLFTHVGVVGVETGEDGIRRFVLVDLPERGARMPATNVDMYLTRTLHYFFLRHDDAQVGKRMGEVAVDLIGNETQFDLTFQTSRVDELKGKDLTEQRIHTYCAGFLLICAQETGLPREAFFPMAERPAGGKTMDNLATLGLSIGDNFVSPTGAIFSRSMQIIGRREPMYHPGREVKEAVYDYFAECMKQKTLTPSPNAKQALLEKLALLANDNPLLAALLANANNVNPNMDLVAAARASAVIETLDEIADQNKDGYYDAHRAITIGPLDGSTGFRPEADDLQKIQAMRARHSALFQAWTERQLTPRQLRIELVNFYAQNGRRQLDERFFHAAP